MEAFFHGRPSGVDHAAVIADGLISFKRSSLEKADWRPIAPSILPNLIIAYAGQHKGTQTAVTALGRRAIEEPRWFQEKITAISGYH